MELWIKLAKNCRNDQRFIQIQMFKYKKECNSIGKQIEARHQRGKRLSAFVTNEAKLLVDHVKRGNRWQSITDKMFVEI